MGDVIEYDEEGNRKDWKQQTKKQFPRIDQKRTIGTPNESPT